MNPLFRISAALSFVSLSTCAGALTTDEWQRLLGAKAARDEQARADAEASLFRRLGLRAVGSEELALHVDFSDETRRRCLLLRWGNSSYLLRPGETTADPAERATLSILSSTASGALAPVQVKAELRAACAFASGAPDLEVTMPGGESRRLARWPDGRFARDTRGELVIYRLAPKVVETRRVTVKMTCNNMPSPEPELFERPMLMVHALWRLAAEPRRIEVPYETVDIEETCTENLY